MDSIAAKDMMVPLESYAVISEDSSLYEAVMALEKVHASQAESFRPHRALLVLDKYGKAAGKLTQLDVIRGLEEGYHKIGDFKQITRSGFTPEFIKGLISKYNLWQGSLDQICGKATHIKVKSIMSTLSEGEYVTEDANLVEAMHQLITGCRQSLLVTRKKEIVGVLQLADVFEKILEKIKACGISAHY